MKQLVVGMNKAEMVDDKGNVYRVTKENGIWLYKGRVVSSPLAVFRKVER